MKRKIVSLIVCMAFAAVALSGLNFVKADIPLQMWGFVGPVDPFPGGDITNPANWMDGLLYNVDDPSLPLVNISNFVQSDSTDPAYWDHNTEPEWSAWVNQTEAFAVLEAIVGLNGWTGNMNYTGSTNASMSNVSGVQEFPPTSLYPIPTIGGTFTSPDTIDVTWTGMDDDMVANVVDYTVFESFDGGPFAVVGTSTPQVIGGAVSFTHTPVGYGQHCYNIGVNYRRDLIGGTYTTVGRSNTVCLTIPTILETFPADGAIDIALDAPIMVNFSHSMDSSTWKWSITPDPGGWTEMWNGALTDVVLSHSLNPFDCNMVYSVQVEYANESTSGLGIVPGPVPNPWTFTTEACPPPQIIQTSPSNGEMNVALGAPITVWFSEQIDTPTFQWTISPDPGPWTPTWNSPADDTVTLTHAANPYDEATLYTVTVTDADDMDGTPLAPGTEPNPWSFNTESVPPTVLNTNPDDLDINVPLNPTIHVNFSEDMNGATVVLTTSPNDCGPWVQNSVSLYYYYFTCGVAPFGLGEVVHALAEGDDLQGLSVDYHWNFTTISDFPFIVSTVPAHNDIDVALTASIVITFSEEIDTGTFQWTINPNPGGWVPSWSPTNDVVTLAHDSNPFDEMTPYTVTVTDADDMDGNALVAGPVPNPWDFTTEGIPPVIVNTIPYDLEPQVPVGQDIIIQFNETMDTTAGQFTYTVEPNPGGLSHSWSTTVVTDDTATIIHANFAQCQEYWVNITAARDVNLVNLDPLPDGFSFIAFCDAPLVVSTDPADGAALVPVNQDVTVRFSEPMNTGTVTVTFLPDPGNIQYTWDAADMNVTVTHDVFDITTGYTATVVGDDLDGNGLAPGPVPNPFTFTTGSLAPDVSITSPASGDAWSGDTPHDITWTMSDDSSTDDNLVVWLNYTSATDSGSIAGPLTGLSSPFSQTWTVACINATDVQVLIEVYDEEGQLGVNQSAQFEIDCAAPQVSTSDPAHDDTGVALDADIVITFSEGMDNTSLDWSISPNPGGWSEAWSLGNTVVTLSHTSAFAADTQHSVTITTATTDDSDPGIGLEADYVFNFTTAPLTPNPPTGLDHKDVTSSELTLTWVAPTQYTNGDTIPGTATITYSVYRADTPTGAETQVATGLTVLEYTDSDVEAGETYYYRVTATVAGQTSAYSEQHDVTVSEAGELDWVLMALILLIIIIIIIIIIVVALRRRKPEEIEEAPPPPEEEVVEEIVEEAPEEFEEVPSEEFVEEAPLEEAPPEEVMEEAPPEAPAEEAAPPAAAAAVEEAPAREEAPAEGKACPNCGTIVGEEDTTCFICGTEL